MRLKRLSDQAIVVTGASSGIGLATAELAAGRGARVMLAARNGEALEEIAGRLRMAGGRVETCVTDVADRAQVEALAERALAAFGTFDTWVNNAAAAVFGRLTDMTPEDHERVFDVGYFGTVWGSLVAVRHLSRSGGGALINLGSILSERAVPMQGAYAAMKHAVRGFTDALRMEAERDRLGISVTLIKPAGMNTPYAEHARNLMARAARIPPVLYDPRLAARAILFAAEHPRRELLVGGTGLGVSKLPNLFPRAADLGMEAVAVGLQQTDQPPPPERHDNLWEPRADGAVESAQDVRVRRRSLWLEAQMRPGLANTLFSGAMALALAATRRGRR